jgi:hypothetical protein
MRCKAQNQACKLVCRSFKKKLRSRVVSPLKGRVGVDAPDATAPLALVRAPPLGFKGLCGAVPAHLERLEDFDIGRQGPRLSCALPRIIEL